MTRKIFIADKTLLRIDAEEKQKPKDKRSFLYKLVCAYPNDLVVLKGNQVQPEEQLLQHPSSLYVLDVPILEAERLQKSYGVCCVGGEHPSIATLIDTNDEHTTNDGEPLGQGWATALQSLRGVPSNALLLSDRYLFTNVSAGKGNGIANVHAILDVLLPQRFLGEYHVTIVFDVEKIHTTYTFNDIVARLERVKQSLHRDYPIMMEVLGISEDCPVYTKLHNRRIVSNYYIVKAEHRLAAFNGNIATSQQTITPQVLFTVDSLNGHSTPPLKSIEQMTAALRSFSHWTRNLMDHSAYCYAVNGERMERCRGVRNRMV
ncbi:MAG: hypothetical protein IJ767_05705 [Bacteroidaceae bacterium]|nr:hypothetical protein [Bacteroidaceae bacterium]MBR1800977.1 hypothetical protein [Bacteroidaceae bacterium]